MDGPGVFCWRYYSLGCRCWYIDIVLFILFALEENNLQHLDKFLIANMQKKNTKFWVTVIHTNINLVLIISLGPFCAKRLRVVMASAKILLVSLLLKVIIISTHTGPKLNGKLETYSDITTLWNFTKKKQNPLKSHPFQPVLLKGILILDGGKWIFSFTKDRIGNICCTWTSWNKQWKRLFLNSLVLHFILPPSVATQHVSVYKN